MGKETKGNRREIVLPGRTRMENADQERGHNSVPGPKCCDIVARRRDSYLSIVSSSPRGVVLGTLGGFVMEILESVKFWGMKKWDSLRSKLLGGIGFRGGKFLKFFFFQRCS